MLERHGALRVDRPSSDASCSFPSGTIARPTPRSRAQRRCTRTPRTGRTVPSRASSPRITASSRVAPCRAPAGRRPRSADRGPTSSTHQGSRHRHRDAVLERGAHRGERRAYPDPRLPLGDVGQADDPDSRGLGPVGFACTSTRKDSRPKRTALVASPWVFLRHPHHHRVHVVCGLKLPGGRSTISPFIAAIFSRNASYSSRTGSPPPPT